MYRAISWLRLRALILGIFALLASDALARDTIRRSPELPLFTAKESSEAVLRFQFFVRYRGEESDEAAMAAIEAQVQHLYGPLSASRPFAVPKNKWSARILERKPFGRGEYSWEIRYSYRGIVQVENSAGDSLEVTLPFSPSTIYRSSRAANGRYPCTDPHYQSAGDFWYFWNPDSPNCPLVEGRHYGRIRGALERLENTEHTYPEYARLVRTIDGEKQVRIDVLFGLDDPTKGRDPFRSADINAQSFRSLFELLEKRGFQAGQRWTKAELETIILDPNEDYRDPYVIELRKQVRDIELKVRLFFGPSGAAEDSLPFHYFMKDAVDHASVFIYSGHSGLGGHLDLQWIEEVRGFRFQPDNRHYQIYFINGCTTYSYYNEMFFRRKATSADRKGTKNLDVITNGLATYFSVIDVSDYYLIDAVSSWAEGDRPISYQRLADITDTENLYGVNGDEDNPTRESDPAVRRR